MQYNFPHIYRKITAGISKLFDYTLPFLLFFLIGLNLTIFAFKRNSEEKRLVISRNNNILGVKLNKSEKIEEINYWESLSLRYPDYQYAHLKLASLYFEIGEADKAKKLLEKYKKESRLEVTPWL